MTMYHSKTPGDTCWEKVTSDKWVLYTIKTGYKLEFLEKPPFQGVKATNVPLENQNNKTGNKQSFREKCLRDCPPPPHKFTQVFTAHFFLFQKKTCNKSENPQQRGVCVCV